MTIIVSGIWSLAGKLVELFFRIMIFIITLVIKTMRWYLPRFGVATAVGIALLLGGAVMLPSVASFSSGFGFNAGDTGTLCGIPGKPPDPTCVSTTGILRDIVAVQSPSQNMLEPLNYTFVREALAAAQTYAHWVAPVAGIGMFLFAFGRKEQDETTQPEGFSPETLSWVIGQTLSFVTVDIPRQIKAGAKYFVAIVFCLVVVSNTGMVLGGIDLAKNQIVKFEDSILYSDTSVQDAVVQANNLWYSTEYAKAHMPEAYAAQTTDAGKAEVVSLAQAIGHGTLPADKVAAYAAGGFTFTTDPAPGSVVERASASVHTQSLGFVVGLLTTLNRVASGAITWLLLGSLGFMFLPKRWLLAIPAAFILTAGTQALLTVAVSADLSASTSHGFTSANAALVATGMALVLPIAVAVLFQLKINKVSGKTEMRGGIRVERLSDFAFAQVNSSAHKAEVKPIDLRKAA